MIIDSNRRVVLWQIEQTFGRSGRRWCRTAVVQLVCGVRKTLSACCISPTIQGGLRANQSSCGRGLRISWRSRPAGQGGALVSSRTGR